MISQEEVNQQMNTLLNGCVNVCSPHELHDKITLGDPLRVKLGLDPTAPNIHLGHTIVLNKLRQFQEFGHKAVVIIGDYTAKIGDPSGRNKTRPLLSDEKIRSNMQTYLKQIKNILLTTDEVFEIHYNSEWLNELNLSKVLNLASQTTISQMLARDTFAKRHKAGMEIRMHEFLYPLLQGYDSVVIRSDVEIGATEQTFNNLLGRDLQRNAGQMPQVVMTMPILIGTDGVEKMSKSLNNTINVTDTPLEIFSRVMSINDLLMDMYFRLLTLRSPDEITFLLDTNKTHPRDAKVQLGKDIVNKHYNNDMANQSAEQFDAIHQPTGNDYKDATETLVIELKTTTACHLAMICKFASSNADAKRLINMGGFRFNNKTIVDPFLLLTIHDGDVVQRGKRKFIVIRQEIIS